MSESIAYTLSGFCGSVLKIVLQITFRSLGGIVLESYSFDVILLYLKKNYKADWTYSKINTLLEKVIFFKGTGVI